MFRRGITVPERNGCSVYSCRASSARAKAPLAGIAHVPTAQDHEEGSAKSPVQKGIEEWVQARVNVSQPQPCGPHLPRHAVLDERVQHVSDEEWCPAQAEAAHNDCQRLGRFGLDLHAAGAGVFVTVVRGYGSGSGTPQYPDLPSMLHSCHIDALVGEDHQAQRHVEGHS